MLGKAEKSSLSFACGAAIHFANDFFYLTNENPISYTVYSISHTISFET